MGRRGLSQWDDWRKSLRQRQESRGEVEPEPKMDRIEQAVTQIFWEMSSSMAISSSNRPSTEVEKYIEYCSRSGMPPDPRIYQEMTQRDQLRGPMVVEIPFRQEYTISTSSDVRPDKRTTAKSKPKLKLDSVIMPDEKRQMIMDAIAQIDHHKLIFEDWGFDKVFEKGTAISLLFYGRPGTGKTLMGQAIADSLKRELKVLGTAEIESSEPGAAERNLKDAFKNATDNNQVLLFDECDSLIGDRRDLGMILGAQVNTLLSCLEQFTGVVIFTTNRLEKLDEAFDRRLSLKLEFEMPDEALRLKLWKRMFPKKAPVAKDVDWSLLAKVPIAGGHIKNVVLRAARRAAASKERKFTHEILWSALESEVKALEEFQDALASKQSRPVSGYRKRDNFRKGK